MLLSNLHTGGQRAGDGNVVMILLLSRGRERLKSLATEQDQNWTLQFVATKRGHKWSINVATERGRNCCNSVALGQGQKRT